ncbi:MAG: aminotransferase class I/II-fold pyridoxal phosphate-dependent enzyme [Pseudomonadota bacterium]
MNQRLQQVSTFHVVEMLERAQRLEADGRDVIHLEVGEPDFPTPPLIVEAGVRALNDGVTRYTAALGTDLLRARIAADYAQRLGVQVEPERIAVTSGASGALLLALAAVCDVGDEVLLPDPGYPCNETFALGVGARPVALPTAVTNAWQPCAAEVEAAWGARTRALLVASPSNPAGAVLSRSQLTELIQVVRARDGWLLLDEIYQGLMLEPAEFSSGLDLDPGLISINSFSKFFGMTGWRLGWLVAPAPLIPAIERLAQNLFISPSAPAQAAALAAFEPDTLALCEQRRVSLIERQRCLGSGLAQLGFGLPVAPRGAFYTVADIEPLGLAMDAMTFCKQLLDRAGVALAPGLDFGSNGTDTLVRFAATVPRERLDEACVRIARFLEDA